MYIYINAQEDVRILTRDEFRIFELYVLEHYQDMYSHKVGYDVHFDKLKDTFMQKYTDSGYTATPTSDDIEYMTHYRVKLITQYTQE